MSYAEIWATLSSIDCSKYIEKKNSQSYLSWVWAWGILMEKYPNAEYSFDPPQIFNNGSVMVFCTIKIGECSRRMWLPVMDHRMKAIIDPDSFAMNTAMMRCLVKCLALYGLGHKVYAGEDYTVEVAPLITDSQASELAGMIDSIGEKVEFSAFLKFFKINALADMKASDFPKAKAALEKRMGA